MEILHKIRDGKSKHLTKLEQVCPIPPRSPDLNPIENLFNIVRMNLRKEARDKHIRHETKGQFSCRVVASLTSMSSGQKEQQKDTLYVGTLLLVDKIIYIIQSIMCSALHKLTNLIIACHAKSPKQYVKFTFHSIGVFRSLSPQLKV